MRKAIVVLALVGIGVMLIYAVGEMPPMGDSGNPDKVHIAPRYLEHGEEEAGASNVITAVILNYRGYDTMGEVAVIFCALCAVVAILNREKTGLSRTSMDVSGVKASVVVRTTIRFLVPVIIFFAVYIILHGESTPGGGFQGGAIIGASIILFTLAFGLPESTRKLPLRFRIPLESFAVIAFLAAGFTGIVFGVHFLTYLMPGLSEYAAETIRHIMMMVIEIGIGFAGGIIFTSIMFAMIREDQCELQPDSP
ncbi:MAG: hypothetical protein L6427_05105 [Actinomycetia bacterium]|nr:hypothetical protein [Actinomycetota bacterium]MBU4240278.1 hypothetical protein [Actinomycetota bacterium]MBU4301189.1 hypothetical protein [Actinomycetota bacterium]MCG2795230.1 hypothetical protein [Actinomycetes bacterium]